MDNAAEVTRISGALVSALQEARALADAGVYGSALADLVRHARELHALIGQELATAGAVAGEHARGLYSAMGERLNELELLLRPDVRRH